MDWNRVFFTRDHHRCHDESRWCVDVVNVDCIAVFCVLCADDVLGSPTEFVVRKKHLLTVLLSLLVDDGSRSNISTSSHQRRLAQDRLINLLRLKDANIVSRFILQLVELTTDDDEQLSRMSMQGAVQLLHTLDQEVVTHNTLSKVIQLVTQSENQTRCFAFLQLINQFLQGTQTVTNSLATSNSGEFVSYLESAIGSVLNDETKNLIIAIVIRLVAELGWIPPLHPLAMKVPREILRTLHLTQHAELKINAFALLRHMVTNSLLVKMLFDVNIEGATFPLVIKRHLLNTRDRQARLLCLQCVEEILQLDLTSSYREEYAEKLLQNDLATFLFELLGTTDEVLLESSLRCCIRLTDVDAFFSGCHAIYGIHALVRSVEISFSFSNAQPSILAFELLNKVFNRHTSGSPLFCNILSVAQVFDILKKGLQNLFEEVSFHAAATLASFLKKQHMVNPIPFGTIGELLKICSDWMRQLFKVTLLQKPLLSQRLTIHTQRNVRVTFKLFASALKLCDECTDNPISIVESYDVPISATDNTVCNTDLDKVQQIILSSVEEIFVPLILSHSSFLDCDKIFKYFFATLTTCFRLQGASEAGHRFAQKLASTGFLRLAFESRAQMQNLTTESVNYVLHSRNTFLESVISRLITTNALAASSANAAQTTKDTLDLQELVREGLLHLKSLSLSGHHLDSIDYLDHRQPQSVKTAFLAMCYYSSLYDHNLLPASSLLPALTNHLLTKQTAFNGTDEKFILFLMAVCSYECIETEDDRTPSIISNCREAIQMLVRHIQGMNDPASVYTHHPLLLKWIFSLSEVADSIGVYMFRQCLFQSVLNSEDTTTATINSRVENDRETEVILDITNNNERFADMFTITLSNNDNPELTSRIFHVLELLFKRECSDSLSKNLLVRVPKMLSSIITPNYHQQLDTMKAVDLLLRLLCRCMRFYEDVCPVTTSDNDFNILQQMDKTIQWIHENNADSTTMPLALKCLNLLLSRFNYSNDSRGATILLTSTKLLSTLAAIVSKDNSKPETLSEAIVILSLLSHHQRKTRLEFSNFVSISFGRLRVALFSSAKHVVIGSLQILKSQLTCRTTGSTHIPCVRLTSVSYHESDSLLDFEGLTVITATLLNLLLRELSNLEVKEAVLSCLLDVFSFTQAKYGYLVSELAGDPWTGLVIEKLINQHTTINDLNFTAMVLKHIKNDSEIGHSVWIRTFEHLIEFFENCKDSLKFHDDPAFKNIEVEILHSLAELLREHLKCAARIKRILQYVTEFNPTQWSQ